MQQPKLPTGGADTGSLGQSSYRSQPELASSRLSEWLHLRHVMVPKDHTFLPACRPVLTNSPVCCNTKDSKTTENDGFRKTQLNVLSLLAVLIFLTLNKRSEVLLQTQGTAMARELGQGSPEPICPLNTNRQQQSSEELFHLSDHSQASFPFVFYLFCLVFLVLFVLFV